MKLNSEKNIVACQKYLYAKQLEGFAGICQAYQKLTDLAPGHTAESVMEKFGDYLKAIDEGKFEEVQDHFEEKITVYEDGMGDSKRAQPYKDVLAVLKEYSYGVNKVKSFKSAAEILKGALTYSAKGSHARIDKQEVEKYHKFMQSNKVLKNFDDQMAIDTPTINGHKFFTRAMRAKRDIEKIDPSLIPADFDAKVTPSAFGAVIQGVRIPSKETVKNITQVIDREDRDKYAQQPNYALEAPFQLANLAGQKFKANKEKIGAAIAAILLAAAIGHGAVDGYQFNHLNVYTNNQNGYETQIQSQTQTRLAELRREIEGLQSGSITPTQDELLQIRTELDSVIDVVVSDLVTEAYNERYPDRKVESVETSYNMNNEEEPYAITVTYTENGEEKSETIRSFSDGSIFRNDPLGRSFQNEYSLDHSYGGKIRSVFSDSYEGDYVQRASDISEILDGLEGVLEDTEQLAAIRLTAHRGFLLFGPSLSEKMPEKLDDNGR